MKYLLFPAALCVLTTLGIAQAPLKPKTESEYGNAFIKSLIMSSRLSPPREIMIFPMLYERNGKAQLANSIFILIKGNDIEKFYELLSSPDEIAIAPESCPNIIVEQEGGTNRQQLRGNVLVSELDTHVRFRLVTGDKFYPKIDLLYESGRMKKFLFDRRCEPEAKKDNTDPK